MTGWQDEQNDELTAQPAVDSTGPDAVEATMTDERAMASEGEAPAAAGEGGMPVATADAGGEADAPVAESAAMPGAEPVAEPTVAPAELSSLTLYLLRHADAGDPMTWTGGDAERPLSKKGRRQAKRLGRHLRSLEIRPDLLLTSPKVRAAETARIVGKAVGTKPSVDERLTIDFGQSALGGLVADVPASARSVMLVGHDPDFSDAAAWLVGAQISMRKGALALIELPDREAGAARGSLRWLLPPDAVAG